MASLVHLAVDRPGGAGSIIQAWLWLLKGIPFHLSRWMVGQPVSEGVRVCKRAPSPPVIPKCCLQKDIWFLSEIELLLNAWSVMLEN